MSATPGQAAGCGCPETDGKIYHQRGTCTDPVVAALDWYADSGRIAAAPEAKPGPSLADLLDQATRELNGATALVHQRKLAAGLRAQAGLEALPLWGAADPVTVTPAETRPRFGSTLILAVPAGTDEADVERLRGDLAASVPRDDQVTVVAVSGVEALRTWEPQPAPERFATEALARFAGSGQWLTTTEDGTLDMRAELLAVKRAVREALDAAAAPARPAPELAADSVRLAVIAQLREFTGCTADDDDCRTCDLRAAAIIGAIREAQPAPELQAGETAYLCHWRFDRGEEFGLYRHAADADAKAAEHAGDGLSEVLSMAILGRPEQPAPELAAAPGDLPKGHFERLQAIGVADNLRSQLAEARAENGRLREWLVGIMRGNDAEIEAARVQADEWITEEWL